MNLSLEQENVLLGSALAVCLKERGNRVRINLLDHQETTCEFHFDYELDGQMITAVTITRVTQGSKLVN